MKGKNKTEKGIYILTAICFSYLFLAITNEQFSLSTVIILTLFLLLAGLIISDILFKVFKVSKNSQTNGKLFLVTFFICLLFMELYLRFGLDRYSTYSEKNGEDYHSQYMPSVLSRYHLHTSNIDISHQRTEFKHFRRTNSMGLCEMDLEIIKKK